MLYENHIASEAIYAPDRYYRYAELTTLLREWHARYPALMDLESIGRSYEDRDIWGVTLTNQETGPAAEKPAYHMDANIHAGEPTGSAVVLYTIAWLLRNHGTDPRATSVLDTLALYLVPRICVDGVELWMTTPTDLRSSVRPYGEPDERDGLRPADIDGDGAITSMRVSDPAGAWKHSALDDRLLVPREPDETEGTFYHLYPEAELVGAADGALPMMRSPYGLDLNRNFPIYWVPDSEQRGAGPYPFSEPEIRALADWMLAHPNLSGSQHFHTYGGIIIRPSSFRPDSELPEADAYMFQALGAMGTQETDYPAVSLWEGFTDEGERRKGGTKNTDLDWVYERLGIYPFTVELWNVFAAAGVPEGDLDFPNHRLRNPEENWARVLRWADAHAPNEAFVPWHAFDHPQLGAVEIGGWHSKFSIDNPPAKLLPVICERNMRFSLRCAMTAPRVRLRSASAEGIADGVFCIRAVVENTGFLPSWVSEQARTAEVARPVTVELSGEGIKFIAGQPCLTAGDLSGRADAFRSFDEAGLRGDGNVARAAVEWIVSAPAGTPVHVTSVARAGGTDHATLVLGAPPLIGNEVTGGTK
jgi:murein tripeptide amidase MpaA